MIGENGPVCLLDKVLAEIDWSNWKTEYNGHRGQPPIHPRYIAGASSTNVPQQSRVGNSLPLPLYFVWLVEGRHIDQTTLARSVVPSSLWD